MSMLSYASCSDGSGELSLDEPGTREMLHSTGQLHHRGHLDRIGRWRTGGKRLCLTHCRLRNVLALEF